MTKDDMRAAFRSYLRERGVMRTVEAMCEACDDLINTNDLGVAGTKVDDLLVALTDFCDEPFPPGSTGL